MRRARSWLCRTAAVAVLVAVAGCGNAVPGSGSSSGSGQLPPEATAIASAENQAENQAGGAQVDNAVDACALLDDDDVAPVVGDGVEGEPTQVGGDGGSCTWQNQENYYSVTVDIGLSGTAAGGDLPPWDDTIGPERPLPDDMRSWSGGQVEFVVDTRDCFVQVVGENSGDEETAVEFARKIRDEL